MRAGLSQFPIVDLKIIIWIAPSPEIWKIFFQVHRLDTSHLRLTIPKEWEKLSILNINHITISINAQSLLCDRCLDRVGTVENLIQLLQRTISGFGDEEPYDCRLNRTPNGKDDVGFPADLLHGDGPCELVQETGGCDGETGESHSLGAHFEGENFDGVESLERCETDRVDGTEDEDESEGGGTGCVVCADGCGIRGIGNGFLEESGGDGHSEPDYATTCVGIDVSGGFLIVCRRGEFTNVREEKKRTTSNTINHCGTEEGPAELLTIVDENDVCLTDSTVNTDGLKNFAHKIWQDS